MLHRDGGLAQKIRLAEHVFILNTGEFVIRDVTACLQHEANHGQVGVDDIEFKVAVPDRVETVIHCNEGVFQR